MKIDRRILEVDAGAATRLIALTQLNYARTAGERLDIGLPESIRDFRDAVRRLRTTLVVYRDELRGSVRRRDRKALRDVVRRFNPRRDLETQLEVLKSLPPTRAAELVGAHLASQLETVQTNNDLDWKGFRKIERRLREGLEVYSQRLDPDNIPDHIAFAEVAARRSCELATDTMSALGAIQDVADYASMRSALMGVTKLRYIIEPLRAINITAVDAAARLSRLQDLLHAQQDFAQLLATIQSMSEEANEPERVVLQELADVARTRAAESYSELRRLWLDDNHKWFFQRIISALTTISEPAGVQPGPRPGFRASGSPWRDPSSASARSF